MSSKNYPSVDQVGQMNNIALLTQYCFKKALLYHFLSNINFVLNLLQNVNYHLQIKDKEIDNKCK